jgi:HPt (histidine-containing phosphotransfer) domain-containing protein
MRAPRLVRRRDIANMSDLSVGEGLAGSAPIDIAHLSRHTAGDRRLGREVLGIFRDQAANYLSALEDAEDSATWRHAAHTLKGAASAIGAHKVAKLAAVAEELEIGESRNRALTDIRRAVGEARRFIDFQLLDSAH